MPFPALIGFEKSSLNFENGRQRQTANLQVHQTDTTWEPLYKKEETTQKMMSSRAERVRSESGGLSSACCRNVTVGSESESEPQDPALKSSKNIDNERRTNVVEKQQTSMERFFMLLLLLFSFCVSDSQEITAVAEVFQIDGSLEGEHFLQVTFRVPTVAALPPGCRILLKLNGREVDSLEVTETGKLGASVVAGRQYSTWVAIALPDKRLLLEGSPIDIDLRGAVKIGGESNQDRQSCYENFHVNCTMFDVSFVLACPIETTKQLEFFMNVIEFSIHGIQASNSSAEIVVVDYNPPPSRLPVAAVLSETQLPEIPEGAMPSVRVVTVPTTRHYSICNETTECVSGGHTFLQRVAVNIGIRRSFGKHVVLLSCDAIPSSDIFSSIAGLPLNEKRFSWARRTFTPSYLYPVLGIVERAGLKSG